MKRKVLFVVHQLNHGGVQKSLLTALNAINYEENEVTLYIRKNRIELLDDVNKNVKKIIINKDNTHYYRKPYIVWLSIIMCIMGWLRKEKQKENVQKKLIRYLKEAKMKYEEQHYFNEAIEYDVAISYIQGYTAQFVAEYIKAKRKVMFFHGSVDENHELHERIMPKFQSVVGVNAIVQKMLERLYPVCAPKITYIENYVNVSEVRNKSREFCVKRKNVEFVLCSCGRLVPVKGYDLAIEAAKILKEKEVSFYWYFVGDGPERTKLEKVIKQNNLDSYIMITGMQDNPYPYIAGCDIYIQPSYEEAHPLSIIEAMILGKPVVTTATTGGIALVENRITGLIAKTNECELVEKIDQLGNEKLLKEIVEQVAKIDFASARDKYETEWDRLLRD